MKTLIATVLAATLALASAPTPVQAGDREDEIAALLFGLATLAIIGRAIDDRDNDRSRSRVQVTPAQPRHAGIPQNRRALPAECLFRVETRQGTSRFFGGRCLERTYAFADRLPQRCRITIEGPRQTRFGYSAACLRDAGFRLARH